MTDTNSSTSNVNGFSREDSRPYSEHGITVQDVPAFVQHLLKEIDITPAAGRKISFDEFIRRLQLRRISLQKCINVLEATMRDAEDDIAKFQTASPAIRSKLEFEAQKSQSPFSPEKN